MIIRFMRHLNLIRINHKVTMKRRFEGTQCNSVEDCVLPLEIFRMYGMIS